MRTAPKRKSSPWAWCAAASFMACAAARGQELPRYSLTLIDSGQPESYFVPRALNDHGEVAGQLARFDGEVAGRRPLRWTPAAGTTLLRGFDGLSAVGGYAVGINNAGQVVGTVNSQAALWSPGSDFATDVAPWPSAVGGINDAGVIAGVQIDSAGPSRAFRRRTDGTLQYLSDPRLIDTGVGPINASGHAAGLGMTNEELRRQVAFVWAPDGTVTPLPGLVGGAESFGGIFGINDQNWVIGAQGDQAILWRPGQGALLLGGLPGLSSAAAESINNAGMVVGNTIQEGQSRAFVWTPAGGGRVLSSLLNETGAGWQLIQASDVNDRGQIVGLGIYQDRPQGFVLTPIPEPTGGLLIAAGALILGRRPRRSAV